MHRWTSSLHAAETTKQHSENNKPVFRRILALRDPKCKVINRESTIDLQVDSPWDRTSLARGRPGHRDLTMASRTGDDKFLAGSTRCSTITPVTAKPPDTTRRSVTEAKWKKPKLEEVVDASFPRGVRESNRLAQELPAGERDSSSLSIRRIKSRLLCIRCQARVPSSESQSSRCW